MISVGWMRSWSFVLVVLLAIGLRVGLERVNRFSNDDHIEVVERMLKEPGREFLKDECWECYQVKVYHRMVATLASASAPMPKERVIHMGQWLNVVLGLLTLALLACALSEFQVRDEVRVLVFTIAALNPRFISINVQATNDTLVIFAGTLTCWLLSRYLAGASWRWLVAACAAALFSLFSKGNGLFVCAGVVGVLAARCVTSPLTRRREAAMLGALVLLVIAGLRWGSPYRQHRERFGSPFVTNETVPPVDQVLSAPFTRTPAAIDMFATFRLFPLLEEPSIGVDGGTVPVSLFTHLYGRAVHLRFDQWPPEWRLSAGPASLQRVGQNIGRAQVALGLFPLFLVMIALQRVLRDAWEQLCGTRTVETERATSMLIMFAAMGAMSVLYAWRGALPSYMKFIFVLPAGLPLVYALARGFDAAMEHRWLRLALRAYVVLSAVLNCADVSLLINQLSTR